MRYGFCFWRFVVFTSSPEPFWSFGSETDDVQTRVWCFGLVIDYWRPLPP
jgi:hypothetical protein